MTVPQFTDPDALPFAGPSPTISGFTMPLPGDKSIPKIDVSGSPTSIPRFLDAVYLLGRTADLSDSHIITWARFYVPPKEELVWRHCAKAAGNSYSAFQGAVLKMYPHSQPVYTFQDLRRLVLSTQAFPQLTLQSFGAFLQDFHRVSGYLLRSGMISMFEEQRMFVEGIPAAYHRELNFSLRLAHPDHAAGVPWPTEAVADEIQRILKVHQVLSHTESQAAPVEAYYANASLPAVNQVQNTLAIVADTKYQLLTPGELLVNGIHTPPPHVWTPQPIPSPIPMPPHALTSPPPLQHVQKPTLVSPSTLPLIARQTQSIHSPDVQKRYLVSNTSPPGFPVTSAPLPAKCKPSADVHSITIIPQACTQASAASYNLAQQWLSSGVSLIPATHERFFRRPDPGSPAPQLPSANLKQPSKHPPESSQAPPLSPACTVCGFTMHQTMKCPTRSFLLNSGITVADMRGRLMQPDGRPFTRHYSGACILDRLNDYFARNVNMIPLGVQIPIIPLSDDPGIASAPQELPHSLRRKLPRQWGVPQDTPAAAHRSQAKVQAQTAPDAAPNTFAVLEQLPEAPPDPAPAPQVRKVPSPFGTILPKPPMAIPDDPDEPIPPPIRRSKAQIKATRQQAALTFAADMPPPWKPPAGFPKHPDTLLAPAVVPLHEINVRLNDMLQVNGVLDSGSSFIGIPRRIWRQIKLPACISNPTHIHTASPTPNQSSHIIPSVKISIPGFSMHAPVHILENAPFDLLLGRPFFAHTHAVVADLAEHYQNLYITDPVTGEVFCLPTCPKTPQPAP
ncbi:hypothetical protein ACEPAI_6979 [Sanghuangporus weigelae]